MAYGAEIDSPFLVREVYNYGYNALRAEVEGFKKMGRPLTEEEWTIARGYAATRHSILERFYNPRELAVGAMGILEYKVWHSFSRGNWTEFSEPVRADRVADYLFRMSQVAPEQTVHFQFGQTWNLNFTPEQMHEIIERNSRPHWITTSDDPQKIDARVEYEVALLFGAGTGNQDEDWQRAYDSIRTQRGIVIPEWSEMMKNIMRAQARETR